jgi:uncharacterized SAM-binding protein YcdF (DUF218 family)
MIKRIILCLVILFVGVYGVVATYIGMNVYKDNKVKSDAIIVLGAKAKYNGKDSPCLVSRINHGISLYKQGYAPILIVSGGNEEAATMKKIALQSGVKSSDILEENQSTSTYENFAYSKDVLTQKNINSLIVITEPFHSPRASLISDKLDISHTVSPATDSPCWTKWKFLSRYFLREPFVVILYKLEGKL